uniref:BTB_2 domain-containing protein n=1 Tax=Steinernema glaseri TaxID=37863 RepID=A0A1I7YJL9_9BILA
MFLLVIFRVAQAALAEINASSKESFLHSCTCDRAVVTVSGRSFFDLLRMVLHFAGFGDDRSNYIIKPTNGPGEEDYKDIHFQGKRSMV